MLSLDQMSIDNIQEQSTMLLERRWLEHVAAATMLNKPWTISKAIRKYGVDDFKKEIITVLSSKIEASDLEVQLISTSNNLYNETSGGDGGVRTGDAAKRFKLKMNDPDVRARNSVAQKLASNRIDAKIRRSIISKKIMSDCEMRNKISTNTKVAMQRPEVKRNLMLANNNHESRERKSVQCASSWNDPCVRAKRRTSWLTSTVVKRHKVEQLDSNENIIHVFASVSEASRKMGVAKSTLLAHLSGKLLHAGGFRWRRLAEPTVSNC